MWVVRSRSSVLSSSQPAGHSTRGDGACGELGPGVRCAHVERPNGFDEKAQGSMTLASTTASELSTTPSSVAAVSGISARAGHRPASCCAATGARRTASSISLASPVPSRCRRPVRTRRAVENAEVIRDFAEATHRAKSWSRERPRHRTHRSNSARPRRALCRGQFHPQVPAHRLRHALLSRARRAYGSSQHPPATGIDRRSDWGQHSLISPETAPSNVSPKFRPDPRPTRPRPVDDPIEAKLGITPGDLTTSGLD